MRTFSTVAADAMVLMSATVASAAARVIEACRTRDMTIVTTRDTLAEARKRLPRLAEHYGEDIELLGSVLEALPVTVYDEHVYAARIAEALTLIGKRDPNDVPLLALALALGIPVWSNDRDFEGLPVTYYPTAVLLKLLESES